MTLRRHHYLPGPYRDHRDIPLCTCGSARDDTVHHMEQQEQQMATAQAEHRRRAGDRT